MAENEGDGRARASDRTADTIGGVIIVAAVVLALVHYLTG